MTSPQPRSPANRNPALVKIIATDEKHLNNLVNDSIARRAFQVFEAHSSEPGHEVDDWFHAAYQIIKPLDCGVLALDDEISVTTDLSGFEQGAEVELFVEPHRIVLRGREAAHGRVALPDYREHAMPCNVVLRSLALGALIDPARAAARFNGCALQISLPKVAPTRRALAQAA